MNMADMVVKANVEAIEGIGMALRFDRIDRIKRGNQQLV